MAILPLIVCLLSASPAFSQPRVYTDADLGRPASENKGTVTPQQLASLAAHQFVLPQHYAGPTAIIGATTDGYMTLPHASTTPPLPAPRVWQPYLRVGYQPYTGYAGYRGYQAYRGPWRSQNAVSTLVIAPDPARAFRPSRIPQLPVLALAPVSVRTSIRRGW